MSKLLKITTSILGDNSVSSGLADELVAELGDHLEVEVTTRDPAMDPVPHLDGAWLQAISTAEADRSEKQRQMVAFSDSLIDEINAADVLVIGLPMYNFSLPSSLKAWIDHVTRAGITFKYTDQGAVGLIEGKKVFLVTAMGGVHEAGVSDFLRPYMQHVLSFIGMRDVEFISAEGLSLGEEKRERSMASAREEIRASSIKFANLIKEDAA